jgi:FixJ family two-component response regulator
MAVGSTSAKTNISPLVLVVDDDGRVRESIADLLSSGGIDTLCFTSAEALLDSGALHHARCLITDVRMPGIDGWELHRRISQTHPQILTIIISAFQEQHAQEHARSVGAFAFLFKPFDGEELLRTVKAALLYAAGL